MVKAVFFDFWGTLVENGTYSPLRQTYRVLRLRMPFSQFAEQFEHVFMTKNHEDQASAFTEVCNAFNIDPKPVIIEKLVGLWNKNRLLAKPFPDAIDTLNALKDKNIKIILISNAPPNNIEPLIERFELGEYFDDQFISYQHGELKTGKLLDIALKKLKLKKSDVVMVGDSMETDIKGAEKAGVKAVLIDRKDRRDYENKITTLAELLEFVEG